MVKTVTYFSYQLPPECACTILACLEPKQAQMSWEAATHIRPCRTQFSVFLLLACLIFETSPNALGSCDYLTSSGSHYKGKVVGNFNIIKLHPVGIKCNMSTEVTTPVSPDALCALSTYSQRETNCLSETSSVVQNIDAHICTYLHIPISTLESMIYSANSEVFLKLTDYCKYALVYRIVSQVKLLENLRPLVEIPIQ